MDTLWQPFISTYSIILKSIQQPTTNNMTVATHHVSSLSGWPYLASAIQNKIQEDIEDTGALYKPYTLKCGHTIIITCTKTRFADPSDLSLHPFHAIRSGS